MPLKKNHYLKFNSTFTSTLTVGFMNEIRLWKLAVASLWLQDLASTWTITLSSFSCYLISSSFWVSEDSGACLSKRQYVMKCSKDKNCDYYAARSRVWGKSLNFKLKNIVALSFQRTDLEYPHIIDMHMARSSLKCFSIFWQKECCVSSFSLCEKNFFVCARNGFAFISGFWGYSSSSPSGLEQVDNVLTGWGQVSEPREALN